MAEVILKNLKKIYPNEEAPSKKKKKKVEEEVGRDEPKANLQITEEGVVAVQQFNLEIKDEEFIVLVGPSGCGKSTTLRMVPALKRSPKASCTSMASWSTMLLPKTVTSPWFSRTTLCILT